MNLNAIKRMFVLLAAAGTAVCLSAAEPPMKQLESLIEANQFDKGYAMVPEILKNDRRPAPDVYPQIIKAFRKKPFAARAVIRKLMEERIAKMNGIKRIEAYGEYTDFLREYAMESDEKIRQILDSRLTLPGITDAEKMAVYLSDMSVTDDDAFRKNLKLAKDLSKKSKELKNQFYVGLLRFYTPPWGTIRRYCELPELLADFPDKDITADTIARYSYCIRMAVGDWDYATADRICRQAMETDDLERKRQACRAAAEFHEYFSARLYDTVDTAQLRLANTLWEQYITLSEGRSNWELSQANEARTRIAANAYECGDWQQVRKIYDFLKKCDPKKGSAGDYAGRIEKYIGFIAFQEENWEECTRILIPFCADKREQDPRVSEYVVRSFCALKKYEEALKYTDLMISKGGRLGMSGEYTAQVEHLKKRLAEQKEKTR